jgi:uncharacterized protein (DUF2267 family)
MRGSRHEAHEATRATLPARLSSGETRTVAEELPDELRPFLDAGGEARKLDIQQFMSRVAQIEYAPVPTAARHTRAVFTALGQALSDRARKELAEQLPQDYYVLVEALRPEIAHIQPPPPDEVPAADFVQSTADRLGLDRATAWHATDAVREMLARRISHGEVDDLIIRLPPPLAGPLEYGVTLGGEEAEYAERLEPT